MSPGRVFTVALLAVAASGSGCGEGVGPTDGVADTLIVSDPVPVVAASALSASVLGGSANEELVFVSLPPGTVPDGQAATVHKIGVTNTVTASIVDGGFDPVPVIASAGDRIEIVVTVPGAALISFSTLVPARRRPSVVRTQPPPRKRDVPLNTAVVIVFNEPVAGASLASGVRLFRGDATVPGAVSLLGGTATSVVFEPSANLDPNTDYRLVVSESVRDLSGESLLAQVSVEFTTGTSIEGPAFGVFVLPDTSLLAVGSQVQLVAVARDSFGAPITGRPAVWSSDNPAVASVSETGLVTALTAGEAHIQAAMDRWTGTAIVQVATALAPVDSIEVTPESATVAVNGVVQLSAVLRDAAGNILRFRRVDWQTGAPAVAGVSGESGGTALVTAVSLGTATITAISEGKRDSATIIVGTIGPFTQISVPCAIAADSTAWCWGDNGAGQLGNGTLLSSSVPTTVAGGLKFSEISRNCALTADSAAFCWGTNLDGALGIGTTTGPEECPNHGPCSTVPVAVAGGHRFAAIDGGLLVPNYCALDQSGDAYCWGNSRTVPTKLAGGFTFTTITVSGVHSCAFTPSGAAYCWGANYAGQLGDGTTSTRTSPALVSGGHAFVAISAGYEHTCGVEADGSAYCWGAGPLGNGSTSSWIPVPVTGALTFAAISAGLHQTCALTNAGAAYCWGTTPVAVAGGHVFATLDAGTNAYAQTISCGVTTVGVAFCWDASNVPIKVPGQP